jgi:hypothetical protein
MRPHPWKTKNRGKLNLFPLFANRILSKSRPEYKDYISWLGLSDEEYSDLEVLARSGGLRATDTLEMFPCPEPTADDRYVIRFFCRGFRHLLEENQRRISSLEIGSRLFLMRDVQNPFDPMALLLRTDDPISVVGYCPRYYSYDVTSLAEAVGAEKVFVSVEQVNTDAPSHFRLLCKLSSPWPHGFAPCCRDDFLVARHAAIGSAWEY